MLCSAAPQRFEYQCNQRLICVAMDTAYAQIEVKEKTGNNDGYQVEKYLRSTGLGKGYPYCAAGLYYCYDAARKALELSKKENPLKQTASTVRMYNAAMKYGVKTNSEPQVGDFIFWRKRGTWRGHVEMVIEVLRGGNIKTIGFNTSNGKRGSQREGNGVFIRNRNYRHPLGRMHIRGFIGFRGKDLK